MSSVLNSSELTRHFRDPTSIDSEPRFSCNLCNTEYLIQEKKAGYCKCDEDILDISCFISESNPKMLN